MYREGVWSMDGSERVDGVMSESFCQELGLYRFL